MKRIMAVLVAVMLIFGMAGIAGAIPYTDTYDAGDPGPDGLYMSSHLFSPDDSVSWTFSIIEDGFNPVTQDVTSASVELNFSDDSNPPWDGVDPWGWWSEVAYLNVGENEFNWEVDDGDIGFTVTSLMTLSDLGVVDATLTATRGDFYFNTATLTAEGTAPVPAPVPEPAAMLLLGLGLFGLAGYGRKRGFFKK